MTRASPTGPSLCPLCFLLIQKILMLGGDGAWMEVSTKGQPDVVRRQPSGHAWEALVIPKLVGRMTDCLNCG